MNGPEGRKKIGIIGAGPSCLFVLKNLSTLSADLEIEIFEKSNTLGAGMPYSTQGASTEHITNVSDNEVPRLATSIRQWVQSRDQSSLKHFDIDKGDFSQFHVLPRLFFGKYLTGQFELIRRQAEELGKIVNVHRGTEVADLVDHAEEGKVTLKLASGKAFEFDAVIVCSGHHWPRAHEGKVKGYYDSPYPPPKLALKLNHAVALKGSSLTAIDAIRTLARSNGIFHESSDGKLEFITADDSKKFKIVMHSRNGLLPAIRFHLREPRLSGESLMSKKEIEQNRKENDGFISLDYLFDQNFKRGFQKSDPDFYKRIKDMNIERFVESMMAMRERRAPFDLFRQEYEEAEKSIEDRKSIFWKEMLAELSFTLNYPAKYLSAEDMLRLKNVLMPLIAVVIAFVPQASCKELFALEQAGKLEIVSVGSDSHVDPQKNGGIVYHYKDEDDKSHAIRYQTFIDCSGQPHLSYGDVPFPSLRTKKTISQGVLRFKSGEEAEKLISEGNENVTTNANGDYFLKVSGITISDHFQVVNEFGIPNDRIYMMAVPYIGGYNPDYSGLDFCEEASRCVVEKLAEVMNVNHPSLHADC